MPTRIYMPEKSLNGVQGLATAICLKAVQDALGDDPYWSNDALNFLDSQWCEFLMNGDIGKVVAKKCRERIKYDRQRKMEG